MSGPQWTRGLGAVNALNVVLIVGALCVGVLGTPTASRASAPDIHHVPVGDPVVRRGQPLARADLRYRSGQYVALVAAQSVSFALPTGARIRMVRDGVPSELAGPLRAGAPAGSVSLLAGSRVLARVALVTGRAVSQAGLGQRLRDYFSRPLTVVLLSALVGCSLLLALLRRRVTNGRHRRAGPGMGPESA